MSRDLIEKIIQFSSIIVFTGLIMGFWLKKKALEVRALEARGSDPVVDALRDDLNDTRAQLAELQERLDFAERMLSTGPASQEDRSG